MTTRTVPADATPTSSDDSADTSTLPADLDVTRLRGHLPPPPPVFADTPFSMLIGATVEEAVEDRAMSMISGPVGCRQEHCRRARRPRLGQDRRVRPHA